MASQIIWTWDPDKDRVNRAKHCISFDTAQLIFRDPLHATREDYYPPEPRLQTIGIAGPVVLMVIHTPPEPDPTTGEEAGRIISARKADR